MTLRSKTILPLLLGLSLLFGCGGDTPTSPSTTSSAGDPSTTTAAPTTSADVGVTQAQAGQIDASIDASVADIFDAIADAIRSALSQGAGGSAQLNIAACNPAVNQVGDNVTIAGSCSVGCDASGTATLSGTLHFTPSISALRGQGQYPLQGVSVRERRGDHRWDDLCQRYRPLSGSCRGHGERQRFRVYARSGRGTGAR